MRFGSIRCIFKALPWHLYMTNRRGHISITQLTWLYILRISSRTLRNLWGTKKQKSRNITRFFLLTIVALLTIKKKIFRFIIFKLVPASNTTTTDMGFFTIVHRISKIFLLLLCSSFYRGFKVNAYAIFFLICHLEWILIFELF